MLLGWMIKITSLVFPRSFFALGRYSNELIIDPVTERNDSQNLSWSQCAKHLYCRMIAVFNFRKFGIGPPPARLIYVAFSSGTKPISLYFGFTSVCAEDSWW